MSLREYIKRFRRNHGMTQAAFADLMKVDQATVSRWESGRSVPVPDLHQQLMDLCRPRDSKADQAIINGVRFAPGVAAIIRSGARNPIAGSSRLYHLQGLSHDEFTAADWLKSMSETAAAAWRSREIMKGLQNGDIVAVKTRALAPSARRTPYYTHSVITPVWLSDGDLALRLDVDVVDEARFLGHGVSVVTDGGLTETPFKLR